MPGDFNPRPSAEVVLGNQLRARGREALETGAQSVDSLLVLLEIVAGGLRVIGVDPGQQRTHGFLFVGPPPAVVPEELQGSVLGDSQEPEIERGVALK